MPAMPGVHPRDFVFGKDYSLMPASDSVQCGVWASECLYVVSWLLSLPLHEFFRFWKQGSITFRWTCLPQEPKHLGFVWICGKNTCDKDNECRGGVWSSLFFTSTLVDVIHLGGHSGSKCRSFGTISSKPSPTPVHQTSPDLKTTRFTLHFTLAQAKACAERKLAFGEMALASRSDDLIQEGMFSWTSHVWEIGKDIERCCERAGSWLCWPISNMHRASLCNLLLAGATFFAWRGCLRWLAPVSHSSGSMCWCFKMYVWIVISCNIF